MTVKSSRGLVASGLVTSGLVAIGLLNTRAAIGLSPPN
ncbi:MAG: hypothetical protein F6K42_07955 [Leptolyngbya sp. SIO1D8]|nr:hypothetical protein [Leptolyngbya sp. SIO1D8]